MPRSLFPSLILIILNALSGTAFAFGSCEGAASAVMQRYGGHDLRVFDNSVSGMGVNASGYVSYTFTRGNQECYVSYFLSGTYFGAHCRENRFGSPESAGCGKLGTWTRQRAIRTVE